MGDLVPQRVSNLWPMAPVLGSFLSQIYRSSNKERCLSRSLSFLFLFYSREIIFLRDLQWENIGIFCVASESTLASLFIWSYPYLPEVQSDNEMEGEEDRPTPEKLSYLYRRQ